MAPALLIKSKKGQALLETAVIISLAAAFILILLKCLFHIIATVALDAMTEDFFFCELSKNKHCEQRLRDEVNKVHLKNVSINIKHHSQKIEIFIRAESLKPIDIRREFNFEKFNQTY